jgi:hypothetical protein
MWLIRPGGAIMQVREVAMSPLVKEILKSFEALPEVEKHELASAILRWSQEAEHPAMTDEELGSAANEIFLRLDREEDEGA